MADMRDQIQELIHEYEAKMKANDLRIEELKKLQGTNDAIRGQLQAILDNEDKGDSVEVRSASGDVIYGTTRNFEYDEDRSCPQCNGHGCYRCSAEEPNNPRDTIDLPKDAMPKGERFEHVVPHKGRPIPEEEDDLPNIPSWSASSASIRKGRPIADRPQA